ncbi:MAG: hypothetical protein HQL52_06735 [Magnetococcales bacterium]|nr:hypothetical protein [Magnetococcales bacterium]
MKQCGLSPRLALFILLWLPALPAWGGEVDPTTQEKEAIAAYQQFANALMAGRFDEARAHSREQALELVQLKEAKVLEGLKIPPISTPMFMIVDKKLSLSGKQAEIQGVQVIQEDTPAGMLQPPQLHRQWVKLVWAEQSWKVISFRDVLEECCY